MKEKVIWGLLALLVVSNVSLHLDGKGRDRRMHGGTERVRVAQGSWQGNGAPRAGGFRGSKGDSGHMKPEGKRGKPEKKK